MSSDSRKSSRSPRALWNRLWHELNPRNSLRGGDLDGYRAARGFSSRLFDPLVCYHGFCMSVIVLTAFGIVMVYSSSSVRLIAASLNPFATARTQLIAAIAGCVVAALIAVPLPRLHYSLCWAIVIAALVLQPLLIPFGSEVNGNRGWLNNLPGPLGALSIQPAELLKIALCIVMPIVVLNARRSEEKSQIIRWFPSFVVMCIAVGSIVFSRDMGTAIVLAIIAIGIQFVGGIAGRSLFAEFLFAALGAGVAVWHNPSRLNRIRTLGKCSQQIDNPPDECYQVTHGIYALNSGGLTGVGLGNSSEKWQYLPESDNDFIFAVIGEEMGFVGALGVIVFYLIMAWCLVVLAMRSTHFTSRLTIMGVFFWFIFQMIVNISVTLDIMPVIGLTLPFLSAGGSSMLSCLCAAGLVVHEAREIPDVAAATGGDFWQAQAERRERKRSERRAGQAKKRQARGKSREARS